VKLIVFLLLALLTGSAFAVGDTSASFIDTEYTTISNITAKAQKKDKPLPAALSINGTALKIALLPPVTSGNSTPNGGVIMPPPVAPVDAIPIYRGAPGDVDGGDNPPIAIDIPSPTAGSDITPPAAPTESEPPATDSPTTGTETKDSDSGDSDGKDSDGGDSDGGDSADTDTTGDTGGDA
jgi:hypothetical protein